jgi:hypothetical protein
VVATREIYTPALYVNGAAVGATTKAQILALLGTLSSPEQLTLLGYDAVHTHTYLKPATGTAGQPTGPPVG